MSWYDLIWTIRSGHSNTDQLSYFYRPEDPDNDLGVYWLIKLSALLKDIYGQPTASGDSGPGECFTMSDGTPLNSISDGLNTIPVYFECAQGTLFNYGRGTHDADGKLSATFNPHSLTTRGTYYKHGV